MGAINAKMNIPQLQKIMADFEREVYMYMGRSEQRDMNLYEIIVPSASLRSIILCSLVPRVLCNSIQ